MVTPGKRLKNGPVSWETIGSAVGMAPIRRRPVRPLSISSSPRRRFSSFSENPVGVLQDHLSLRRQTNIPMAALDDRRAEVLFQKPNGGRQSRLRDMTNVRGAAKVFLAGQRREIFELTQDHRPNSQAFVVA